MPGDWRVEQNGVSISSIAGGGVRRARARTPSRWVPAALLLGMVLIGCACSRDAESSAATTRVRPLTEAMPKPCNGLIAFQATMLYARKTIDGHGQGDAAKLTKVLRDQAYVLGLGAPNLADDARTIRDELEQQLQTGETVAPSSGYEAARGRLELARRSRCPTESGDDSQEG